MLNTIMYLLQNPEVEKHWSCYIYNIEEKDYVFTEDDFDTRESIEKNKAVLANAIEKAEEVRFLYDEKRVVIY